MTPDAVPEVRDVMLTGEWHGAVLAGTGRLRLAEHALRVERAGEPAIDVAFTSLSGAEWRAGRLTVFGPAGWIRAGGAAGLDALWTALHERSCTLPELTTGLRSFGSRRGGDAATQARFFAPLLQARRRLEEQRELQWRLAAFEATALRRRVGETVRAMAAERYAADPRAERALAACLLDECAPLFAALDALGEAAAELTESPDAERFAAWRMWTGRARGVFEAADRAWSAALTWIERGPTASAPRRRRTQGGAGA